MRVSGSETEYRLHQWSNDWISADPVDGGKSVILSPTRVKLSTEEVVRMRADEDQAKMARSKAKVPHTGTFWLEWKLNDSGYFTKLR